MGLGAIVLLILTIMFGPPVLFLILGLYNRNKNKESAKAFFILAAVWLIIGGGICATVMLG